MRLASFTDEEMDKLREEQRKRHEEIYGIPSSGIPGEEEDSDDDLQMQLVPDNGDNSADGIDLLGADEVVSDGEYEG
jgi:hypothetical protein